VIVLYLWYVGDHRLADVQLPVGDAVAEEEQVVLSFVLQHPILLNRDCPKLPAFPLQREAEPFLCQDCREDRRVGAEDDILVHGCGAQEGGVVVLVHRNPRLAV
jgi:hypothetical protein